MRSRLRAAVLACVLLAAPALLTGCFTTEKSGRVGETLSAGGLKVAALRIARRVRPAPRPDYSGLGTPSPGTRFTAVKVKVCNDRDDAIGPEDFGLELAGGGKARVRYPQSVIADGFESTRQGCDGGWLVFEAPRGARPGVVTFAYDNTGSAQPGSGNQEKHARFRWAVTG